MEKYIKTMRNPTDQISRCFSTGVSRSFRASSASTAAGPPGRAAVPFSDAPYPASSTAAITAWGEAAPSTPMELVSRLTEQAVTPGTWDTAFSTLALQAAQLMPVTLYCFMISSGVPFPFLCSPLLKRRYHSISR